MQRNCLSALALIVALAHTGTAADWPQFRGANGDSVSTEKNLPARWSEERGVLWKAPLPGRANASPAVTAKRIDLTTQETDNSLWVLSFDKATGKPRHKIKVGSGTSTATADTNLYAHRHNAATPSPIADEKHIWAFFGTGLLVCVDAEQGKLLWSRDLVKDYGAYNISFGMGASPRIHGDRLFVSCMTKGPSYVVAFDKMNGRELWKVDRKLPAELDGPDAYTTPVLYQNGDRTELLVSGSDHVNSYDPATGKEFWRSAGLKIASEFGRVIASPATTADVIIVPSANPSGGKIGHILALRSGGAGDITQSHKLWSWDKSTPDSSSPVCYEGLLSMCNDQGIGSCLDLKTGEVYWQQRLAQGPYHASLVAGDGKIYFLSIDGTCTVMAAGKSAKVLAENKLPGTFYATPAISNGVIYLRAYEALFAVKGEGVP